MLERYLADLSVGQAQPPALITVYFQTFEMLRAAHPGADWIDESTFVVLVPFKGAVYPVHIRRVIDA